MKKETEIIIECKICFKEYGRYNKKEIPKTFICDKCNTPQTVENNQCVGYTHKRNYPLGFFY